MLVLASGAQYTPRPCQARVAPHRDIRPRGTDGRDRFGAIRQRTVLINGARDEQKFGVRPNCRVRFDENVQLRTLPEAIADCIDD